MEAPLDDSQLSRAEQMNTTLYRIVLSIYVRCSAAAEGRRPPWQPEDIKAWAEKWSAAIQHDVRLLGVVMEEARRDGIAIANDALHRIEPIDHEMLDLAIEWAVDEQRKERTGETDGEDPGA